MSSFILRNYHQLVLLIGDNFIFKQASSKMKKIIVLLIFFATYNFAHSQRIHGRVELYR